MSFDPVTFNPLGHFNPEAPADAGILAKARALLAELPHANAGDIDRIYLHWSVAPMCDRFADYNVMILSNTGYYMAITHTPADNAVSTFAPESYAAHTYCRNEGAVGVCLSGMDGATETNFGPDPETVTGLTHLCAAAAAVALKYGVDVSGLSGPGPRGTYAGEHTILTHAEAANLPGEPGQYGPYGPPPGTSERWDLAVFTPLTNGAVLDKEMASMCGDALREVIRTYKIALEA
jgi:hypothetical protein